jgi:hypothetical protein
VSPSPDTYQPLRGWDDLIEGVVRRGSRLRRRRLLLKALPLVVALGAGLPTLAAAGGGGGRASLQIVTTDRSPSPSTPTPSPTVGRRSPAVHHSVGQAVGASPGAPVPSPEPSRTATLSTHVAQVSLPRLTYRDPSGDAVGAGVGSSSQSSDITAMTFESTTVGLRVGMELLGYQDDSHYHYVATLHSAQSGCDLEIALDAAAPGATAVCNGATVWRQALPTYTDGTRLQVTLPWGSFPRQVSPHDLLTTSGAVTVADTTGSGHVVVDSASSPRRVRLR